MPQHPFPDPGPDGQEPDGFPLPPAAGEEGPDEDGPGLGQGLYVCLPAGPRSRGRAEPGRAGHPHHPLGHPHAEAGYHPSRKLAHLIRARSATCTAPGCRRPAARCDLDHTIPWDQGGLTCECGLAAWCKR